jgi:recombinational DNA repair ATPase RecF
MITELRVRGVRGIAGECTLPIGGRALVIHGGNGTGKSSFARALEWALTGRENPPAGRAVSDEESYRRHVLAKPADPRVEVSFRGGGKIIVTPEGEEISNSAAAIREACVRASPFLRRSQVLEVVAGRPIDRFRYLEGYLDLEQADQLREALAERAQAAKGEVEKAEADHASLLRQMAGRLAWGESWTPPESLAGLEAMLVEAAARAGLAPQRTESLAALAARARRNLDRDPAATRTRLSLAQDGIGEVAREAEPDLEASKERVGRTEGVEPEADLAELLALARGHFENRGEARDCPVCRQGIDRRTILADLDRRIGALKEVQAARQELRLRSSQWRDRWARFLNRVEDCGAALGIRPLEDAAIVSAIPVLVSVLQEIGAAAPETEFVAALTSADTRVVGKWMGQVLARLEARIAAEVARLPAPEATRGLEDFATTAERFTASRESLLLAEQGIQQLRARATRVAAVADAVRRARQTVAKELLAQIAETVRSYYVAIHPQEGEPAARDVTGPPEIAVQRQREGTAYIRGAFNGEKVADPRWVYSDGHLDTVGLCIFLALRRFTVDSGGGTKLLVLDDVVSSIDLDHARNLVMLLREKFADHQVLLFTHNELFAHWCAELGEMGRLPIRDWTLQGGPAIGDHASTLERLDRAIAEETSPWAIASVMAKLLDEWLVEFRYVHQLSVRAKRGEQYTLTELWEATVQRLKQTADALGTAVPDVRPLLERLKDVPKIRNGLAAHENEFAREWPLRAIREVALDAAKLVRWLYCPGCKKVAEPAPGVGDKVQILSCRCGRIAYRKGVPWLPPSGEAALPAAPAEWTLRAEPAHEVAARPKAYPE